ncbi:trehalose-phosphatase [Phyllobacterium endophyticum]|uniref:trehalose-phosphatase n=1 Tax=Phyllobacterium endophyticum TaxID=1149773 RepID=UPI0011C873A8|nr:trehalose-phosphatase [Phyllobacterium endophyticum]TXR48765.1 trehalose-phosphatase [Phyllobacterium endophyticum]
MQPDTACDNADGPLPSSLDGWALFIDIDGTLIDLATTPESIVVPPDLPDQLMKLSRKVGGALALVTGRSIAAVDTMFAPHHFTVAGLHGAEIRRENADILRHGLNAEALDRPRLVLQDFARHWPGMVIEDKGLGLSVHYRQAPEAATAAAHAVDRVVKDLGYGWKRQDGKMVVEIGPAGTSKGIAVAHFMETAPYAGRKFLVIGDDLTDETMFHYAREAGGRSIRVGDPPFESIAEFKLESASDVRSWIARATSEN